MKSTLFLSWINCDTSMFIRYSTFTFNFDKYMNAKRSKISRVVR